MFYATLNHSLCIHIISIFLFFFFFSSNLQVSKRWWLHPIVLTITTREKPCRCNRYRALKLFYIWLGPIELTRVMLSSLNRNSSYLTWKLIRCMYCAYSIASDLNHSATLVFTPFQFIWSSNFLQSRCVSLNDYWILIILRNKSNAWVSCTSNLLQTSSTEPPFPFWLLILQGSLKL